MKTLLKAPFPYFGGKSRAASLVWDRFGDVPNYIEPFFGSGAVLLGRPHDAHTETVNDIDCYLANFWRAITTDPVAVASFANYPVNEADLHARHQWLVSQDAFRERMKTDPDYYDPKIAGWWVWGLSCWIGTDWCPHDVRLRKKRPRLGDRGIGVHRLWQTIPYLSSAGQGINRLSSLGDYFQALQNRLRQVRVCCGDWSRVLGESVTVKNGKTAVFLDPPYADTAHRDPNIYTNDSITIAHDVREWALANGDNPMLRIALAGYDGEHDIPETWECVKWKASGGYGSQRRMGRSDNHHKERIWFSPHCLHSKQSSFLDRVALA